MQRIVKNIAVFFATVFLLSNAVIATSLENEDEIIQVGLFFAENAMPGANLQNYKGVGFRFGYLEENSFVKIGITDQTKISMLKTQNVFYSPSLPEGGYGYSDQVSSEIAIGCYHLRLNESFSTFDEAQIAASTVGGFPAWVSGEYQVRLGAYTTREAAETATAEYVGTDVVGSSEYGITVVVTGTDNIIFQYDGGSDNPVLTVKPGQNNDEKSITHFKGYKYYGDFCYERINGKNLTVVNRIPLEDYVNCVVSCEMSDSWPIEALKAQAVCARSYTKTCAGHSSDHFDVCNTTCCQAYYGMGVTGENTAKAVEETTGEYALYANQIIQAFYHSSDGGATENCENVWVAELPYIRGVEDPYEALIAEKIPNYKWTREYTGKQLQEMFNSHGYMCDEIVSLDVTKTTETGNVYSVSFTDISGTTWTVSKYKFVHSMLGARSMRYSISGGGSGYYTANGDSLNALTTVWTIDGSGNLTQLNSDTAYVLTGTGMECVPTVNSSENIFTLTGTGRGHNLGMSQWGAHAMALEGHNYKEILKFYFSGIEIVAQK